MLTKIFFDLYKKDIDFVINNAAPGFSDKQKLKKYMLEDESFRDGLIGSKDIFDKITRNEKAIINISPRLLFEILLRRTKKEFEKKEWALERIGMQKIPVFDVSEAGNFLNDTNIVDYMSNMLSSFTKIESFTIPIKVREGIWHKIRFNDMDIDRLRKISLVANEEFKFYCYKRIADVCLFILGIFPEYVLFDYRYPHSKDLRPKIAGKLRRPASEYESEARKFYNIAAEQQKAYDLDMVEVLQKMSKNFSLAKRIMDFIAQHYLHILKNKFFDIYKRD